MKVYLDTNVIVGAVATRGLCADLLYVVLADHDLVAGERLLAEVRRVLKTKLRLPAATISEVEAFLRQQGELAATAQVHSVKVRDPADARILAEALGGGAAILVTGDRDLLDVADRAPLRIVSPRGMWDLLRGGLE